MKTLTQPTTILLLFIVVRCADLAISAALAKSHIRAACYGIVAILALIALVFLLFA